MSALPIHCLIGNLFRMTNEWQEKYVDAMDEAAVLMVLVNHPSTTKKEICDHLGQGFGQHQVSNVLQRLKDRGVVSLTCNFYTVISSELHVQLKTKENRVKNSRIDSLFDRARYWIWMWQKGRINKRDDAAVLRILTDKPRLSRRQIQVHLDEDFGWYRILDSLCRLECLGVVVSVKGQTAENLNPWSVYSRKWIEE